MNRASDVAERCTVIGRRLLHDHAPMWLPLEGWAMSGCWSRWWSRVVGQTALRWVSTRVLMWLLAATLGSVALAPARAADAEPRVALVIGNAAYADGALRNPVNDAREMARTLRSLGFLVLAHENLGKRAMEQAVLDYGRRIAGGGVGLVFYAGHGLQVRGRNYLVPVDARITDEAGTRVAAVDVDLLLEQIVSARNRVNLVILDACRNNPFERRLRGSSQGLAAIDAARGTLVAYATAPGSVAADGDGAHGLYTDELLKALRVPGLKIEEVFKRVRVAVAERSKGAQTPWESSSLTGDLVVNVSVQVNPPLQAAGTAGADRDALFWASVKDSKDPADYQSYLNQFPAGTFAELARRRLAATATAAQGATVVAAPGGASRPASVERRFDGAWTVRVVCADLPSGVLGYTKQFQAEVVDGVMQGQDGAEGAADSIRLNGRIEPGGSALLAVRGVTGDPRFNVNRVGRGSPYQYRIAAQFDDRQGSGRRLELRPCDVSFVRR
jgi:uncharacterized caspase-like protein